MNNKCYCFWRQCLLCWFQYNYKCMSPRHNVYKHYKGNVSHVLNLNVNSHICIMIPYDIMLESEECSIFECTVLAWATILIKYRLVVSQMQCHVSSWVCDNACKRSLSVILSVCYWLVPSSADDWFNKGRPCVIMSV